MHYHRNEQLGGVARPLARDPAERRVIRQLVEALLFEGLVQYEAKPRESAEPHGSEVDPIYDQTIDLRIGADGYRCAGTKMSFGRFRVAEGSVKSADGLGEVELVELVRSLPLGPASKGRLRRELEQTVELCRWNSKHLAHQKRPRRSLGFHDLESALVEGHPYHPCFKTRTGFSLDAHRAYGPESAAAFQLEWLAVVRTHSKLALPCEEHEFWRQELGSKEVAVLQQRVVERGDPNTQYGFLPVHPWQLDALRVPLEMALVAKEVVLLGRAGDHYQATQSLRTLVNRTRPEKANLKLPLDVVCTSSSRNLVPEFVCTAPVLSSWLTRLVAEDPYLRGKAILLEEYAGIVHDSGRRDLAGKLGVIFRQSVLAKLEADEAAVPFTAVLAVEADGRPFVFDWTEAHGVQAWLDRLIEVVLLPIWHLLVHHGVAFEAHAQNLILIHRRGWPEKVVLRDFHEETEFVPDFLGRPELLPRFEQVDPFFESIADDDGYRMASTESLRQLFMDTVYVFNFADLAFVLQRHLGFGEERFWSLVRKHLATYERANVTERARIERIGASRSVIVVESLLKKKMFGGGRLDYFEHEVESPLAGGNPCSS